MYKKLLNFELVVWKCVRKTYRFHIEETSSNARLRKYQLFFYRRTIKTDLDVDDLKKLDIIHDIVLWHVVIECFDIVNKC